MRPDTDDKRAHNWPRQSVHKHERSHPAAPRLREGRAAPRAAEHTATALLVGDFQLLGSPEGAAYAGMKELSSSIA